MIRVSNSLDPDQGPNCLQRLSADDTSSKELMVVLLIRGLVKG